VGLAISGMSQPDKVIGFLDVFGAFDPTLAFVMVGAIVVHAIAWRIIRGRPTPLFATGFLLPSARQPDLRLALGSAIFGVGWGLGGYCPGPGLVALGSMSSAPVAFVVSMLVGMIAFAAFEQWRKPPARLYAEAVDN
jgi:uncharacterized membrane protein YedE/YeeE